MIGLPTTAPIFVTGGTGRAGTHLVRELLKRGYTIRALTSRTPPDMPGVEWKQMDFIRDLDFGRMLEGCYAVLHLAAEVSVEGNMKRINADATAALADAAERAGVKFFCYTSSVAIYGSPTSPLVSEDTPVVSMETDARREYNAASAARFYARTKLMGESAIQMAAGRIEYVVLRPTTIVSDNDIRAVRSWNTIRRVLLGYRHTHHLHVADFVHAILWFMERALAREKPKPGVEFYNLSNDDQEMNTFDFLLRKDGRRGLVGWPSLFGMIDVAGSMLKYRNWDFRYPYGMVRYSPKKLYATCYEHAIGIENSQSKALGQ
jgi:nucleoside-diphosphate-sugar epimerase